MKLLAAALMIVAISQSPAPNTAEVVIEIQNNGTRIPLWKSLEELDRPKRSRLEDVEIGWGKYRKDWPWDNSFTVYGATKVDRGSWSLGLYQVTFQGKDYFAPKYEVDNAVKRWNVDAKTLELLAEFSRQADAEYEQVVAQLEAEKANEELRAEEQRQNELAAKAQAKEEARQRRLAALTEKYGARIAQRIIERKVWIGISAELARKSWGNPKDINRTTTASVVTEQWVYGRGRYLYFRNGKLTSIQN